MATNLLIVESPAKAKTIEKFLGKDFKVASCNGHIRDLEKGGLAIDTDNQYQPKYIVPKEKSKVVTNLKKLVKEAEEVWLATDEDREGEAISWHLCEVLGLNPDVTKRIVFHEITKSAIQEAITQPRGIDKYLVNAQQARRVLDRLVGFEISPILWKKISSQERLSAGRVQSVAVRLIVDREREINNFLPAASFKITGNFTIEGNTSLIIKAEYPTRLKQLEEAEQFLNNCVNADFKIIDIQTKPAKKSPSAPFITSTLQQEASRKLSFSVTKTMVIAQRLYESGHITYMRTDSVNLSDTAVNAAADEISKRFGKEYSHSRQFKGKAKSAQEAHEAIRPTYFERETIEGDGDEERLYELIWKRTVASQMSDAKLEKTTAKIEISTNKEVMIASGEVLLFDGFLKLYMESRDEDPEEESQGILPPLVVGQNLDISDMMARERFTKASARYNEATLVRKLEELGIGRPSTYAPTITTIQRRKYVVKQDRDGVDRKYTTIQLKNQQVSKIAESEITGTERAKLFPTDIGMVVNDFLTKHFDRIMDFNFTAKIEEEFDEIANGNMVWNQMIDDFYKPFHSNVEETIEKAEKATGERQLGMDPESNRPVSVRIGRYGPMAQMGVQEENGEKPKYAKLKPNQNIETITFEEALELFKASDSARELGVYEEKEVVVSEGRYGPYIRHGSQFVSLGKELQPEEVTLEKAIELLEEKKKKDAERIIQDFEGENIQILKGPYGPFIKAGRKNVKIPEGKEPASLTLAECKEIIKNYKPKRGRKKK